MKEVCCYVAGCVFGASVLRERVNNYEPMQMKVNFTDHIAAYESIRPMYMQFTKKLGDLVKDLIATKQIDIHLIESRTKEIVSFSEKISNPSKNYTTPLTELNDFTGIRIIAYYQEDVVTICKLIESEFDVDKNNSITKVLAPDEFGYKSVHYVVKLTVTRSSLIEWESFSNLQAEIQVRTVLQHAWGAISHKLQYKREDDIPTTLKRKLFRLSALLELADEEFVALRKETGLLTNSIGSKITAGDTNFEINLLSVEAYLNNSPEIAKLAIIATEIGFNFDYSSAEFGEDEFEDGLSKFVGLLKEIGLNSIAEVDDVIRKSLPKSKSYLAKQFNEGTGTWYVSPEFICQLIFINTFRSRVTVKYLLSCGWGENVAKRVLSVAQKSLLKK